MNVNDGTTPCPTCLSAASMSTLKAVADLRTRLAAMTERAAEWEKRALLVEDELIKCRASAEKYARQLHKALREKL